MFKIMLMLVIFTLAACSDKSNKSSSASPAAKGGDTLSAPSSSDFGFIADINLRNCLDDIGMTVESVPTVVCAGKGIKSLEGMDKLPLLKNLNVSHNKVSDLTPLANVKGLQVLYATNNEIDSIDALNALPDLNAISLRSNQLSDPGVFYTLPKLAKLYVQGNTNLSLDATKLPSKVIVAI